MEIKKTWTASLQQQEESNANQDLLLLAGCWNTEIEVNISNPAEVIVGPIVHKVNTSE